ncbi:MAG: hypothetical protein ABII76_24750 [Pseudomonadota bacterium]
MTETAIIALATGVFGLLLGLIGGSYGFTWLVFTRLANSIEWLQRDQEKGRK